MHDRTIAKLTGHLVQQRRMDGTVVNDSLGWLGIKLLLPCIRMNADRWENIQYQYLRTRQTATALESVLDARHVSLGFGDNQVHTYAWYLAHSGVRPYHSRIFPYPPKLVRVSNTMAKLRPASSFHYLALSLECRYP
jgi:hypothetical protein